MTSRPAPDPHRVTRVLTVLVLLGSALCLVLALTRPDPRPPADLPGAGAGVFEPAALAGPGGPAVAAMVEALPVVLGYEAGEMDTGLEAATALMTRPFARRFVRSYDASARPLARREQGRVEAMVRGAGLVRVADDGSVVGLAYVDQVLVEGRSLDDGGPRVLDRYRVQVRLVEQGSAWRIAGISPV